MASYVVCSVIGIDLNYDFGSFTYLGAILGLAIVVLEIKLLEL